MTNSRDSLAPASAIPVRAPANAISSAPPTNQPASRTGSAVVMVRDTTSLYPAFGKELAAVVLSAVMILELFGPLATQFALRRAREAHPDG